MKVMPRGAAIRLALAGLALAPTVAASAEKGPACFTAVDNRALAFEVIQQAPPPAPGARNYEYYPLTGAATMQLGTLSRAEKGYARYYFQWGNRSNAPMYTKGGRPLLRKPNFQSTIGLPRRQRTPFTTVQRANACTLAQTANVLGLPRDAVAFSIEAGITLVNETAQPDAGPVGPDDTCVLANGTLPKDGAGVLLDYEVQDGRTGEETLAFLQRYVGLVRKAKRKAILLLDPIDAPSQRYNGISDANAHAIVDLFDRTTIFLWSRNRNGGIPASYEAQKAMISAGGPFDGSRILVDFELSNTSVGDAAYVHDIILRDRLAGLLLWRNGAQQGGSCDTPVNQKIAMAVFGRGKRGQTIQAGERP